MLESSNHQNNPGYFIIARVLSRKLLTVLEMSPHFRQAGPLPSVTAPDTRDAVAAWQAGLQQQASHHTLDAYQRDLAAFLRYLADRSGRPVSLADLAQLALDDFNAYRDHCASRGRAPASIARALSTLRHFFRFLAAGGLAHNLGITLVTPPRVPRLAARLLSPETVRQAIEAVADLSDAPWIARRDAALFALLYGSGLRLGEALALNRSQVPQDDSITLAGKGGKPRTVPVLPFVSAAIAEYLHACPYRLDVGQPLFVGARGRRLNPGVVQRQMRRLRVLLGLPARTTPQVFRQCFAQRVRAAGGDLRAIQHLLGHAHPATTPRCFSDG
jgi:integrase/recombinase XerC